MKFAPIGWAPRRSTLAVLPVFPLTPFSNPMHCYPRRCVALALLALAFVAHVAGQTPQGAIVLKGPGFLQTSATVQESFQPGYGVFVIFAAAVPITTSVQLVRAGITIQVPRVAPDSYYAERYFETEAQLEAALPDGAYTLTVSGGGTATNTPITIPPPDNIRPPLITNFTALQSWTEFPLRIDWQPIVGGTPNDILSLTISRGDETEVYESTELTGASTGIIITSLSSTPGETLFAELTYARLTAGTANAGQTLVGIGRAFFLRFPLTRGIPPRPAIAIQPQPQSVVVGSTVAFSVGATGTGLSYQWRRNGATLSGANRPTYIITNVQPGAAGSYSVDVTNAAGATTSQSVTLAVVATTSNPGRISNLAIRSQAGTGGQTLIVGLVIGGGGTTGPKPLLLRGIGPALAGFGVPGTLADPRLEIFSGALKINENDNWNGDAQVAAIGAQVGAFALGAASTRDAALYNPAFPPGNLTIQVTGGAGASGVALAEIYDATPVTSFSTTTPRLINVSARTQVGLGADVLIAGFVIAGGTSKTVVIRAVGPTLAAFGVPGTLIDPKLDVYSGSTVIHTNDNWGGDAAVSAAFASVGAFALTNASRDAAVVVTLPPGNYTAQVSGVGNTTGVALVEVYEVP